MRWQGWLLGLILLSSVVNAQTGTLRVFVRDEEGRPTPAILRCPPQIYKFCNPWDALTLSQWHSWFLSRERELGREPTLREWHQWMIQMGMIPKEQERWVSDEQGVSVQALRPDIYSVYAWAPGYGVACAHHVIVRPEQETAVTLTLPRVPITLLQAQVAMPSRYWQYASLRLEQRGWVSPNQFIWLSAPFEPITFWQFPLANWHHRARRFWELGGLTAIFEVNHWEARKPFVLHRLGETINLGTVQLKPKPGRPAYAIPVTVQVFWSDGKTPAFGIKVWDTPTDREGRVILRLAPGGHYIWVRVPRRYWHKGMTSFHWLYVTPKVKIVRITLPEPAKLRGTVKDENGNPVVNAEVRLERFIVGSVWVGGGEDTPSSVTHTDERGVFAFEAMMPGKFQLSVWDGRRQATRYLSLQGGQKVEVALNFHRQPLRQLKGEGRLPSGEPVSGAAVTMLGSTLFTDAEGRFETQWAPTEEPIFIWSPAKGATWQWLTVTPSDKPLTLSFTLENGAVQGRLVDKEGHPLPMEVVRLQKIGFYFTELLAAHTDADGRFTISPVPSGEWQLVVEGPPCYYSPLPALVKTVKVPSTGTVDVGTLTIPTSVSDLVGRVIFPPDFGRQEGERRVEVVLQPEGWWDKLTESVTLSATEFRYFHLPLGTYWLLAKGGGWASEPQKVIIPETGGTVNAKVLLARGGSLRVTVRDKQTSKPLSSSVTVIHASGTELGFISTDSRGEGMINSLPVGRHILRVWKPFYRRVKLPVTIKAGETTVVTVDLEPKP